MMLGYRLKIDSLPEGYREQQNCGYYNFRHLVQAYGHARARKQFLAELGYNSHETGMGAQLNVVLRKKGEC